MAKKPEPNIQLATSSSQQSSFKKFGVSDVLWILCREIAEGRDRAVSAWGGWLLLTNKKEAPEFPSSVEYMRPIHHTATENSTIQEILRQSKEASQRLGQKQTIITFDLVLAKKAYLIIWSAPEMYKDVIG